MSNISTNDDHLKWKTLSSEYLSHETWFTVRKDTCEKSDGTIVNNYYVFEFPQWATAFALTVEGKILMTKQYRHALGEVGIELPGGCVDKTDASFEEGIKRELLEETGYEFNEIKPLGKISANPSTNYLI
jgi:8-oxo-dGTP pyrophosphatase MutT (NUDIX family)